VTGVQTCALPISPAGTVLHIAHRAVESLTLDREVLHLRDSLIPKYSELVYYGFWFSPEREILQNTVDMIQKEVTGTARLKLYKGNCLVVGRKSPKSLYHPELATFESEKIYNQKDAEGFIKLNALRLKVRKLLRD
jgi:argininosuccinate synthase